MVKIFLRVFFVTFGLILCVFFSVHFFSSLILGAPPLLEHDTHRYLARFLENQLKTATPADVKAMAEELCKETGYNIYPRSAPEVPAEMADRLLTRSELVDLPNDFDTTLYLPFDQGRQILAVGPIYTRGGPPADRLPYVFSTVVIVVGLLALFITRPAWQNIRRFEDATRRLSEGDMTARALDIRGPISDLARRFNRMADALEHTFESQKHLLQAVSHELRTPVARIHFELELLQLETEKGHERGQSIVGHLTELNDLLDELMVFVRLDANGPGDKFSPFPLKDVLDKLESDFRPDANNKLVLESDVPEDFLLVAQQRMFTRALGNLLQNALRYAQTQVHLTCHLEGNDLVVCVTDDGPGIPEDQRQKIFEPFWRPDESRNKKSGGVGLGLAIVQRILTRHGGKVHIESSETGGARFVTRWPVAPS